MYMTNIKLLAELENYAKKHKLSNDEVDSLRIRYNNDISKILKILKEKEEGTKMATKKSTKAKTKSIKFKGNPAYRPAISQVEAHERRTYVKKKNPATKKGQKRDSKGRFVSKR